MLYGQCSLRLAIQCLEWAPCCVQVFYFAKARTSLLSGGLPCQHGVAHPATQLCASGPLPGDPNAGITTGAPRRVGPFSGAILAALVYEIAFRPEFDGILRHRGPGVGLFPGMAGVEGEEKTGAAGDVLPPNALTSTAMEGGGFQADGNREAQDKYHPV